MNFGAMDAGPTDLTRVLLMEFSLVYGNDWYVVPLRLPVGSLFRVTSFTVRDTFGVTSTLPRSRNDTGPRWSVFDLVDDYLFLPPTLAQSSAGQPVEQVQLTRDESANLAWGIERLRARGLRRPYERKDEADAVVDGSVVDPRVGSALVYRLASSVPDHWIPFAPVSVDPVAAVTNPVIQLERRAIQRRVRRQCAVRCTRKACCSAPTRPAARLRASAADRGGGGAARRRPGRARLPVRPLVRRRRSAVAGPPQDRRPRRVVQRAALRRDGAALRMSRSTWVLGVAGRRSIGTGGAFGKPRQRPPTAAVQQRVASSEPRCFRSVARIRISAIWR